MQAVAVPVRELHMPPLAHVTPRSIFLQPPCLDLPAQQRAFIILHECFNLTGLKDEILGASGDYAYTWEPGFSQLTSAEHASTSTR